MRGLRWAWIIALAALLAAPMPAVAQSGTTTTWFDRDVVVADGEHVSGDLMAFGGRVHVMPGGTVDGNVTALGADAVIEGLIEGDVVALGGSVTVAAKASIMGDLVVFGDLDRDANAFVRGNVVQGLEAAARLPGFSTWGSSATPETSRPGFGTQDSEPEDLGDTVLRSLGIFVVIVLIAALVAALVPGALQRTSEVARRNWGMSIGIGALTGVLVAVLTVISALLVLICIGLPLLLVLAMALVIAALVGWATAGQVVGRFLAPVLRIRNPALLVETALGTAFITLFAMIPWAGPIMAVVLDCWGVGAAVLANTQALRGLPASPYYVPASPTSSVAYSRGLQPSTRKGDTKPLDTSRWPFVPEEHDPGTPQQ